jgi:MFS family permease
MQQECQQLGKLSLFGLLLKRDDMLESEPRSDAKTASLSISMVILGIALANLPFGILADRYPIKPIVLIGGTVITATSLTCAAIHSIVISLRRALSRDFSSRH